MKPFYVRDNSSTVVHDANRRAWERLRWSLSIRYGGERATQILAGNDPATNADLAAWRNLGAAK